MLWQKISEIFWRIHLNIIFWILLWMLASLVIWNLDVTVSTTLKCCRKQETKIDGRGHEIFPEKITRHEIFRSMVSWATKCFCINLCKNLCSFKKVKYNTLWFLRLKEDWGTIQTVLLLLIQTLSSHLPAKKRTKRVKNFYFHFSDYLHQNYRKW